MRCVFSPLSNYTWTVISEAFSNTSLSYATFGFAASTLFRTCLYYLFPYFEIPICLCRYIRTLQKVGRQKPISLLSHCPDCRNCVTSNYITCTVFQLTDP